MTHELRFQVGVLPNIGWDDLLKRFRWLEDLGFDIAATGDHFVDWTNPPSPWFEAWTLMTAIARETSRIRISTCVTQIPFRNPALLANQALTLDHVSEGRLELGLGTGLPVDPSCEMMGIPNWTNKERVARFKEYVDIVDQLLSNEVTSFEGHYYQVKDAVMNPRPVQKPRPPIVIAAMGPVMMKQAARFADNWNSLSFASTFEEQLEETRGRMALMDQHCEAVGRDPASLRRSYLMFDPGSRSSGGLVNYYQSEALFTDMVGEVIALGVSEIGLYFPTQEQQWPVFERIATEVIPRLKREHGQA